MIRIAYPRLLFQNGCAALHGAAASGQLEVVQWMLQFPGIDSAAVDDVSL